MKYVYASRTGNVESIVNSLNLDALYISDGDEKIDEDFILFTYTDGFGDVPYEVECFLKKNGSKLKGVIVSGDISYGEAYCMAGDIVSKQYKIPCLYKVENEGTLEDLKNISNLIKSF